MNKKTKTWLKHFVFLIFGILIFGMFIYFLNDEHLEKLKYVNYSAAIAALVASFGITLSISLRWGLIVNTLAGDRVASWREYYHYFIQSRALGFILPNNLTDVGVRMFWLKKRHQTNLTNAGVSVALDRVFDLIFLFGYTLAVLPYWFGFVGIELVGLLVLIVFAVMGGVLILKQTLFFSIFRRMMLWALKILSIIPFLKKKAPTQFDFPDFPRPIIVKLFFISAFKVLFTITRFVIYIYVFSIAISPYMIIAGTPVAQLSYAFSFTPGGLGILEAGWLGILKLGSVPLQQALLFIIGQRILTIVLVSTLAVLSQLLFSVKHLKNTTHEKNL
ncbi:lysylphosphatidylglycerol synthase transmembrane domain-containing protein [Salinivirga cyanobacteriivorans]